MRRDVVGETLIGSGFFTAPPCDRTGGQPSEGGGLPALTDDRRVHTVPMFPMQQSSGDRSSSTGMKGLLDRLAGRGGAQVLVNASWLYLDHAVRAVLSLATFSAVARHLGPEEFGVLSYAVALTALFLPFANLGLDFVVVQELVRRPADRERILATAAALLGLATLVGIGVALACVGLLDAANPARSLAWITVFLLLGQPFLVIDWLFQSRIASRQAVLARLGSSIVANGFRLGLVMEGAALGWFAAAFVLEAMATGVGLLLAHRASGGPRIRPWREGDRTEAKFLLREAWPLMAGGVAMAMYLRLDQLLLQSVAGTVELGNYAAAARLGEATQLVTYALILSYFPRFVAAHAAGGDDFVAARRLFLQRITWVAIAVAVGVSVLAPWISHGLLGARFTDGAVVLALMAWANVFAAQIGVRGKWFLLEGWQLYSMALFGVGACAHLVGVYLLAPRYGAIGAAASFCFAQMVMALAAPLMFSKIRLAAREAWLSLIPRRLWP